MPHFRVGMTLQKQPSSPQQRKRQRHRDPCCRYTVSTRKKPVLPFSGCLFLYHVVIILVSACTRIFVGAQEEPNAALTIPSLTYPINGSFRTNFCHAAFQLYHNSNNNTGNALQGMEGVLDGVELRVALYPDFNSNSLFEKDDNGRPVRLRSDYPGLIPSLLDEVCNRAGCTWRNSYVLIPRATSPNTTFTDLIAWTTDVYDLSANFWLPSVERLQTGITFTEALQDGTVIMIANRAPPGEEIFNPWGWLAPFDGAVWITIALTLVVSTLVHGLIEVVFNVNNQKQNEEDSSRANLHWWDRLDLWKRSWQFATAFAGQFEFAEPNSGPDYLFTFSVAFWALLMGASYTANLASFLVIRNRSKVPINTVEEAVQQKKRICVRGGTIPDDLVTRRFPLYAASDKLVRIRGQPVQGLNGRVCDIALVTVSAWDAVQRNARFNGDCQLEWIGRPFVSIASSFAVRSDAGAYCTSLLRDALNLYLVELENAGVRDLLWQEHIENLATVDCSSGSSGKTTTTQQREKDSRQRRRQQEEEPALSQFEKEAIREDLHFFDEAELGHAQQQTKIFNRGDADSGPKTTTLQLRRPGNKRDAFDRRLRAAARRGVGVDPAVVASGSTTTRSKLTLTNMGGVFLLHVILSLLSVVLAIVAWARKKYHGRKGSRRIGTSSSLIVPPNKKNKIKSVNVDHGMPIEEKRGSDEENDDKLTTPTMLPCSKGSLPTHPHDFSSAFLAPQQQQHCADPPMKKTSSRRDDIIQMKQQPAAAAQKAAMQQLGQITTTVEDQHHADHAIATLKALKLEMMAQLEATMDDQIRAIVQSTTTGGNTLLAEEEIIIPRSLPRVNLPQNKRNKENMVFAPSPPCSSSVAVPPPCNSNNPDSKDEDDETRTSN